MIQRLNLALALGLGEVVGVHHGLNIKQTGVGANGPRLFTHEFHAVVVTRVVAGGHHNAAVGIFVEGGVVHLFGATQADVEHVGTAFGKPFF